MIRVERPAQAPAILTEKGSKGRRERALVLKHYRAKGNAVPPAFDKYAAYREPEVKEALKALFHNKCAYCEIGYGGTELDIDHFRPKGAVVEVDPKTMLPDKPRKSVAPGYYWLAASWTNLLPACPHCNRPGTHQIVDGDVEEVRGKSNFFPLATGSNRILDPKKKCEQFERPLLIDPTRDHPSDHLEFGDGGTIRSKRTGQGPDARGEATIKVFGLQRDPLVRDRKSVMLNLLNRILDVKGDLRRIQKDPDDQDAREALKRHLGEVDLALDLTSPYLAMCRQIVQQAFQPLKDARQALKAT